MKRDAITSAAISAAMRELNGALGWRLWQAKFGNGHYQAVLNFIDSLGVSTGGGHSHRPRALTVSVDAACAAIEAHTFTLPERKAPHGNRNRARRMPTYSRAMFVVVSDPTDLFKTGAEFPADQVWGIGPGELPDNIIMRYIPRRGEPRLMRLDPKRGLIEIESYDAETRSKTRTPNAHTSKNGENSY